MNKLTQILLAVLIGQICMAALLNTGFLSNGIEEKEESIIAGDLSKVDAIQIVEATSTEAGGSESLELKKVAGKWVVPSLYGFPAASSTIEELISKFTQMKGGWPVATTTDAAKRFKVGKDDYEKKVSFLVSGKPVAEVYVGSAPSFKKRHVRAEGKNEIFVVNLNPYDLSLKAKDWLDKSAYTLDSSKVKSITTAKFTMNRVGDKWKLEGISPDKVTNQVSADGAFNALLRIVFTNLEGDKDDPEFGLSQPVLEYSVILKDADKKVDYKFGKRTVNDGYILKTSDKNFYVSVSKYVLDNILKLNREQMIASKSLDTDKKEDVKTK